MCFAGTLPGKDILGSHNVTYHIAMLANGHTVQQEMTHHYNDRIYDQ